MRGNRRGSLRDPVLQVDSLMDILACTVGIVLLVVVFSVLEFRGTPIRVTMPLAQKPPSTAQRAIVLCSAGKVRLWEHEKKVDELLAGFDQVSLAGLGGWVARANARAVKDEYFTYGLNYEAGQYFWGYVLRYPRLELVIKERPGFEGESLAQLEAPESYLRKRLQELTPNNTWLSFAVAEDSLEEFRLARSIGREAGYATGWDPFTLSFPYRVNLLAQYSSDPLAPNVLSTQQ